jgi:hypothetical protein
MTVREWFRMARGAAWVANWPEIQVYFRNETMPGPLTPVTRIIRLIDIQHLIEEGAPEYAIDKITQLIRTSPSYRITE